MQCVSPVRLVQPMAISYVPCGKCNYCLQTKRGEWTFRLMQELKAANFSDFITLTYSDEKLPTVNEDTGEFFTGGTLRKRDVQLFNKRLRKAIEPSGQRFRFFTVGEYGERYQRPHYHSIMFNMPRELLSRVESIWGHGGIYRGSCTVASIHYTAKYIINRAEHDDGRVAPFSLMSRRPGIGEVYLRDQAAVDWHVARGSGYELRNYTQVNGVYGSLPRYYKERIFTKGERAWLGRKAQAEGDKIYLEEIDRLSRLEKYPERAFEMRKIWDHEFNLRNINKTSIF